jgi:Icc protein
MRRIAWLTDLHLDFPPPSGVDAFIATVAAERPDAVVVGGDTSTAETVAAFLVRLEKDLGVPVFFVLGNHDFYHGSIAVVTGRIAAICGERLRWLSRSEAIELDPETCLVGHDGWADGRLGDYEGSDVRLNDFVLIRDFLRLDRRGRLARMQELAGEAADHLASVLPGALDRFRRVIVLTHVPPFDAAAWHEGRMSEPDFLPFFSSKVAGDVLREAMLRRRDREMLVLCGHTHGSGEAVILPNLRVWTGGAVYGNPSIACMIDLADPFAGRSR